MENYSLRPIEASDMDFMWDILYYSIFIPEGFAEVSKDIVKTPEMSVYLDNWGRTGDMGYIIELEGKAVGAIWCRIFSDENHAYGYINDASPELGMAMIPGYRGKGLGSIMMQKLMDEAKLAGFKGLSLSVDTRNSAVFLYKKFGFDVVSTSGDTLVMKKEL